MIDCPKHLDELAAKEWHFIVPQLQRMGILHDVDKTALEMYCSAYSRWVQYEEKCKTFGEIIKTKNNYPQISPYAALRTQAFADLQKMLALFGLTPAARANMSIHADDEQQDDDDQWWQSARLPA